VARPVPILLDEDAKVRLFVKIEELPIFSI